MRLAAFSARRAFAVALAVLFLGATLAPEDADARAGRGGSFGSRGARTYSAPPPTATAPGASQMERSMTQPGQPGRNLGSPGAPAAAAQTAARPGGFFGGGLGAGLMGGLLGAGLFGLLSGSGLFGGLGSMSSFLGLLLQIGVIFIVARLVINWMRRRQSGGQPAGAAAGGAPSPSAYQFDRQPTDAGGPATGGSRYGYPGMGGGSAPVSPTHSDGDPDIKPEDFDVFERLLSDVQEAWSKQDLSRLRGLATPEMVEMFGEDLADDASRGVVNKVSGVKLLQGDMAEAWTEGGREFATVAMRYEFVDVTEDRETGQVVEGDAAAPIEATELWTFMRARGGRWLLSAIQQGS